MTDYNTWVTKCDDDGNCYKVNTSTGEVRQGYNRIVYDGDIVLSPEARDQQKKFREEQEKRQRRRAASKELGRNFYFLKSNQDFPGLTPQSAARLVYLITYADYDNKLKISQKTDMHRTDLPKVLGVSAATASRFFEEVSPGLIEEKEDGTLYASKDIFKKGKIDRKSAYYKMYVDSVRRLYQITKKEQHRYLGYAFQLLQYVNFEFNVICSNPSETELDRVEFMTLAEFCQTIGYDKSHLNRLLKIYRQIRFDVGDHTERFVSIVFDGLDRSRAKIFVNPHILYSGTNHERVEILGEFCKG